MSKNTHVSLGLSQNHEESTDNNQSNYVSRGLTPDGLSINHNEFPDDIQKVETETRLRRAAPLYPSEVLGDSYKYGQEQLKRKYP